MQADHDVNFTPAIIYQPWDEQMQKSHYYPPAVVNKALPSSSLSFEKPFCEEKGFLLWNFHGKLWQTPIQVEIYIVKYCCLHLAVIVHYFIRSVNQIFKAWIWTAHKHLAFQCLCWIYGAPLAQILCSGWEHTRKYWFALELIGIAAFGDIWMLIALINLAIKTVNMLPTQKRFWSRSEARSHYHNRKLMRFWFKFWCGDGSVNGSLFLAPAPVMYPAWTFLKKCSTAQPTTSNFVNL